jgi:hypothetical protein
MIENEHIKCWQIKLYFFIKLFIKTIKSYKYLDKSNFVVVF